MNTIDKFQERYYLYNSENLGNCFYIDKFSMFLTITILSMAEYLLLVLSG